jgi:type IV pilus assembly protein PilB
LLDMKIDPFLVGSSLVCSVAQRLARRICRNCGGADAGLSDDIRREMAKALGISEGDVRASRGGGCVECNDVGARGRTAIYEFFQMNDELADAIEPGVKLGALRELARRSGWRSLRENGFAKVQEGLVSVTELDRITRRVDMALTSGDDFRVPG